MSAMRSSKSLDNLLSVLDQYEDKDVSNAVTLPRECYTSEEFFELEREKIFADAWLCVGHELDFVESGDFFGVNVGHEPLVIVKGNDGQIRALSSVCRHRWAQIIEHGQRGSGGSIQCPYHRWTYGLDGKLNSALFLEKNKCFDQSNVALPEYRLEIWNGFIFVNLNDDAIALAPQLAGLDEQMKAVAEQLGNGEWKPVEYYSETWKCNWKLFHENNSEGYHHMGVHIDTLNKSYPSRMISPDDSHGTGDEASIWTTYDAPLDVNAPTYQKVVEETDFKTGHLNQAAPYLNVIDIFPSTAFTISAGGVGWFSLLPTAVDEVVYIAASYSFVDLATRRSRNGWPNEGKYRDRPTARVLDEDGEILPAIQNALTHGRKVEPVGCLSWQEQNLTTFYKQLARKLRSSV